MADPWNLLITNALIGTDRQPPAPLAGEGQLATLLSQVSTAPEPMLLQSAGLLASYQQAGKCPLSQVGQIPSPCPAETLSRCSERTHQHLQTILSGEYRDVLPELLNLIAQAHQHVPPDVLPALLNHGRGHTALRSSIQAVIGERGRWLAQQNSVWAYAAAQNLPYTQAGEIDQEAVENLWKTSDYAVRIHLLKTFRSLKPQAAQEMLEATWKQEKAKDRATFLATLATQLSLTDEPFLETALCDRAQDVRTCAGDLLARLPESQYSQRLAAQLETYVQWTDNILSIQLPKDDGSWHNLGLAPQSHELGKRGHLLMQIVAAAPLNTWSGDLALLIQAAHHHQHGMALCQGWTLAAQRQAHIPWAEKMLSYWLQQPIESKIFEHISSLWKLLPDPQVEQLLSAWLTKSTSVDKTLTQWVESAKWCPMLSPAFSQVWWQTLQPHLQGCVTLHPSDSQARSQFATLRMMFEAISLYLHPVITDDVTAYLGHFNCDTLPPYQQNRFLLWQNTLTFRQAIWTEFQ